MRGTVSFDKGLLCCSFCAGAHSFSVFRHKCMPQAIVSGTILAAGVSHCWQQSLGPHPPDLSSSTFNTGVLSMLWTILQPRYVGWRQRGHHLLYH